MENIKILRLSTNEDVICEILEEDDISFHVYNPNNVEIRPDKKGGWNLVMMPWITPELIANDDIVMINKHSIVSMCYPKDNIIQFFTLACEKQMYARELEAMESQDKKDIEENGLIEVVQSGSHSVH